MHESFLFKWRQVFPVVVHDIIPLHVVDRLSIKAPNGVNIVAIRRYYGCEGSPGRVHGFHYGPFLCEVVVSLDGVEVLFSIVPAEHVEAVGESHSVQCSLASVHVGYYLPLLFLEIECFYCVNASTTI